MTGTDRAAVEATARTQLIAAFDEDSFDEYDDRGGDIRTVTVIEVGDAVDAAMTVLRTVLAELERLGRVEQERNEDVRAVDTYLAAVEVHSEQADADGSWFLRLRARFADLAARDEREGDRG